ncbi:hypothetical protein OROMI_001228 [Orobanche minor]
MNYPRKAANFLWTAQNTSIVFVVNWTRWTPVSDQIQK